MTEAATGATVRLIKKYPNRRLYDTQTSTYITLADVKQLVLENELFKVVDAKSSEDLTRSILLQTTYAINRLNYHFFNNQITLALIERR